MGFGFRFLFFYITSAFFHSKSSSLSSTSRNIGYSDIKKKLKTDTFPVKERIRLSDSIACRRHRFNFFASSKLSGERLDSNWDENYVTLCKGMSYKSRFVAFGAIEKISEVINPRRSFLCYIGNDSIDKDAVTFYASQ